MISFNEAINCDVMQK